MIKEILKKIIYGNNANEKTLIKYLKNKGATIGDNVHFYSFRNMHIDPLNAHLLHIGNNVNIVASTILTHDYSWSVIKGITGEILGNQKEVYIGDNVFIGDGSIILCGSVIEGNSIIGARSVVTGRLPEGYVYAGNPIKPIMTIDEYIEKRRKKQIEEAQNFVRKYLKAYNELPDKDKLHEYFFLFENNEKNLTECLRKKMDEGGNYELSSKALKEHKLSFNSYDEFIKSCLNKNN